MARNSQTSRRSSARPSNPALIPGLIALVLIVGAVIAAVLSNKPKEVVDASAPTPKPFAEMPPEAPPPPRANKPGSNLPMAPESIASEPQWVKAQAIAAEAKLLYQETVAAKAKGDQKLANEKGGLARDKYDEAVTMTADWEESTLSQYNEYDSKIRAIKEARTEWFNKLLWLKKSVVH